MRCQVCGTVDNKHGRGPVKVFGDEGVCLICKDEVMVVVYESQMKRSLSLKSFSDARELIEKLDRMRANG